MAGGGRLNQPVSIICPYRDAARFLPDLIQNVLQQTYAHWELLLIDDSSVDRGPSIAFAASRTDRRIRALTAPQRSADAMSGPWWPRNFGILHAQHALVAFLDADDRWHPAKLQRQLIYHQDKSVDISITGYAKYDPALDTLICWRLPPDNVDYKSLLWGNRIPMLTVIVDRSLVLDGFQPCRHEDYLLWLNLFRKSQSIRCKTIHEMLGFYAVHANNLTSNRLMMPVWAYSVFQRHGIPTCSRPLYLIRWCFGQVLNQLRLRMHRLPLRLSKLLLEETPRRLPISANQTQSPSV